MCRYWSCQRTCKGQEARCGSRAEECLMMRGASPHIRPCNTPSSAPHSWTRISWAAFFSSRDHIFCMRGQLATGWIRTSRPSVRPCCVQVPSNLPWCLLSPPKKSCIDSLSIQCTLSQVSAVELLALAATYLAFIPPRSLSKRVLSA
jgi:hypothetical protein